MTLAEKKAKALELREQGWKLREIAAEFGAPISTVQVWVDDPDGAKQKARRVRYCGTCRECGARTNNGGAASGPPDICRDCFNPAWTRESVIDAIRDFADDNGGIPPRTVDARRGNAGHGRLPYESCVKLLFGSWNEGLIAAGYVPHQDKRPETNEAMAELIREGVSTAEVADRFGCSESNVAQRVRRTGTSIREIRQAA